MEGSVRCDGKSETRQSGCDAIGWIGLGFSLLQWCYIFRDKKTEGAMIDKRYVKFKAQSINSLVAGSLLSFVANVSFLVTKRATARRS
jgi:hypothetical protein